MARQQDDLNAAVAALTTAVTRAVDEIKTETQNILDAPKAQTPTNVDPDAVESAANTINATTRWLRPSSRPGPPPRANGGPVFKHNGAFSSVRPFPFRDVEAYR
jgi:hypothetical protein